MNTRVAAFANNKGGVAKTTTALTVGLELARRGRKVLLVDLDAQASLTGTLIDSVPERGVYDAFTEAKTKPLMESCIIAGGRFVHPMDSVDLLPADRRVETLDANLAGKTSAERILLKVLRALDATRRWDAIIIDCPPSLGIVTKNALTACDHLLVPVTPEYMPVSGLVSLQEKCEEIAEDLNPGLEIDSIAVTRYDGRLNLHRAAYASLKETFGDKVLDTRIRNNVAVSESPKNSSDVIAYAPGSKGAEDYRALTDELEARLWPEGDE